MATIQQNYDSIQREIAAACARVGRDSAAVTLVAVSKTVGYVEIERAIEAGICAFGENRAAQFKERQEAFPHVNWHFIGNIQTNKIKDFVGRASLVHSVASERVLRAIDARAATLQLPHQQKLLIEVNISGEESKEGAKPHDVESLLLLASKLQHIKVDGLMTMAPLADEITIRKTFQRLRALRDTLAPQFSQSNICLSELSMGMSQDYVIAVEEGATIVRVGRSIWK